MKKIIFLMLFCTTLIFAQDRALLNIVKNISIPNVAVAINDAKILQKDLNDKNFTNFIKSWKKVEAIYFAGEFDENYLDTPRYMDVFNNLKEDLNSQMKRVIESNDPVNVALFKNSFKSVNALEYVLYNDKDISKREKELSIAILDSLISHLEGIQDVYKEYLTVKPKDIKWENALIINTLIGSSYRLKEWRVGNPSGLSSKFKNDAKNERAEYFLSKNSFSAIEAILEAQRQIVETKDYYNFVNVAKEKNAQKDIALALTKIDEAKANLAKLKNDDFSNANELFKNVKDLHNIYYLSLIEQLGLSPKVLDADGD
jgi:predicted lipoprotein